MQQSTIQVLSCHTQTQQLISTTYLIHNTCILTPSKTFPSRFTISASCLGPQINHSDAYTPILVRT